MKHYDCLLLAITLYESECRQVPLSKHVYRRSWLRLEPFEKQAWLKQAEAEYRDTRP